MSRAGWLPYALVAPALVLVMVVVGIPFVFNTYLTTTNASVLSGFAGNSFVGPRNFGALLGDRGFQEALRLTFLWTGATLALQMLVGLVLGLLLHDAPPRLSRYLQGLWLLPWVIPAAAAFYIWRILYNQQVGPIHQLLAGAKLIHTPLLSDPALALWAIVVAAAWKGYPFYMLLFRAALQGVPTDLYDAARVDGANRRQIFWHVEREQLLIVGSVAAVLGFIWTFNWVTPAFVMTNGGPGVATRTLGLYIYQEAIRTFDYANAAVAATVLVAIVVALLLVARYLGRRSGAEPT
jgi:multiple sugar transport system permease protein